MATSENSLAAINDSKRIFLAGGLASVLSACGTGNDSSEGSSSASAVETDTQLLASFSDEQPIAKHSNAALNNLFSGMSRELLACRTTVIRWNLIANDACALDHTPNGPGETRLTGEQGGPHRASRALAIVHIAMHDALASISRAYVPYSNSLGRQAIYADPAAATARAAHDCLAALYPSQRTTFSNALSADLARISPLDALVAAARLPGSSRALGLSAGAAAAAAILADRANDGSSQPDPTFGIDFIPLPGVGIWSPDPVSGTQKAIGARWAQVRPFALQTSDQFRCPAPPALGTAAYAASYNEVQSLGGDGQITSTNRTADQQNAGIFWAYDGVPKLGVPPRLYNQITIHIANQQRSKTLALTRLLMLTNVAMADTAICCWESKYFYQTWRPVIGVRASITGATIGSATPDYLPLGAPATNTAKVNFTPPFPAYPSGHSAFGGALFETLRRFYRTDAIPFTFTSEELNGVNKDNSGNVRPLAPRSFANLSQAEAENGQSRIYLGIHWQFDNTEGIAQGRKIANWVIRNV